MPRKKTTPTTAQRLRQRDAKAQADEIARIIGCSCELLDSLLVSLRTPPPKATEPVIARMRAFLDRRGVIAEDPPWIAKMRRTVGRYESYQLRRANFTDDAFSLD